MAVGLTFGILAGTRAGSAAGLDPVRLYAALILLTIPALVGSRLLFAVANWRLYRGDFSRLWSPGRGGAALYGGLILALACSWPVLWGLGLSIPAFWDAATITILVGMAFTKIGCQLGGCCAGRETAAWWGVRLPNAQGVWRRRIPSQMLESGLAIALLIAVAAWRGPRPPGSVFLVCLAVYAAARLGLERTREEVDRIGGVSVYSVLSLALGGAALAALWFRT